MKKTRVAAIIGPTAVGKSELAIQVAERLGAEVVSVDSMQIYRGMDIGTDKATPAMRARIPHHLLDLRDPDHVLPVSEYQELARGVISEIEARGRLPLLVGGSGLYFRAVVDDLEFPPRATEVREALEDEAASLGAEVMHARLAELDPAAARRIEPRNARRTIRALEVISLTGRPFSDNDSWDRYESRYHLAVVGLTRSRDELWARVEARVDQMLDSGLVAEAASLRDSLGATARQALGYKQMLDSPDASPAMVRDMIVRATKRFARRQESWFRGDPRVTWFEAHDPQTPDRAAAFFEDRLGLRSEV
jgi:tRNA dimethylallyltransferase